MTYVTDFNDRYAFVNKYEQSITYNNLKNMVVRICT